MLTAATSSKVAAEPFIRSMTLLNQTGDITLGWTEDQDAMMAEVLQKKIDEGYSFFFLKGDDQIRLKKVADIPDRKVIIADKDAEALIKAGKIGIIENMITDQMETTGRAKTGEEAASGRTVGVKPAKGG